MGYRVFAQQGEPGVDLAGVIGNTRRYFECEVEVLSRAGPSVRLRLERDGEVAEFSVTARGAHPEDLSRAREAERLGRAAGMATLAARCAAVWEVAPDPGVSERVTLTLCAVLASVALGPVLPPDCTTLFGVRGALSRARDA